VQAYEGLFLVDEGRAKDNLDDILNHIRELLERHGASVRKLEKWDSRRLAYEIEGKRRGTYLLAKFDTGAQRIAELKRDCRISNVILRALILREDKIGTPLAVAEDEQRARRRQRSEAREKQEPEAEAGGEPAAQPAEAKKAQEPAEEEPAEAPPTAEQKPAETPAADTGDTPSDEANPSPENKE
jgi:small subunit ribosomal protein S6